MPFHQTVPSPSTALVDNVNMPNGNKENSLVVDCMKLSVIVRRSWQNTKQQYVSIRREFTNDIKNKENFIKQKFIPTCAKNYAKRCRKSKRWRIFFQKKPTVGYVDYENPFGLVRPIILYGPYAYYIHAELLWVKDPRSGMCAACVIRIVRTHNLKGLYKPTPIVGQVSVDHQRSFSFNHKT